jgi:hypothetical protein
MSTPKIGIADIEKRIYRINVITGSPLEYFTALHFKRTPAIGHYYLESTDGGYKLLRVATETGGAEDTLRTGPVSKAELARYLDGYISGILDTQAAADLSRRLAANAKNLKTRNSRKAQHGTPQENTAHNL